MLLIRDVFHCKPGKAAEVARRLQRTIPSSEAEDGFRNSRVLVDYVGSYWTVVLEAEAEDLSRFDHHMSGYGSRPDVQEAMRGYTDLVTAGYREVFRILPDPGGGSDSVPGTPTEEAAMITLDLTPDERAQLVEILQSTLSDLRMEIADTDRQEFRDGLKERKRILGKVLQALGAAPT